VEHKLVDTMATDVLLLQEYFVPLIKGLSLCNKKVDSIKRLLFKTDPYGKDSCKILKVICLTKTWTKYLQNVCKGAITPGLYIGFCKMGSNNP
jgi:hypothetical protein